MQVQVQQSSLFFHSPSFNCYTSQRIAEIAARVIGESEDNSSEVEITGESADKIWKEVSSDQKSKDKPHQKEEDKKDDDFDFTFACGDTSSICADEIFTHGQIRPIYPILNRNILLPDRHDGDSKSTIRLPLRKLFIEEEEGDSLRSSEADELEGVPADTYCVWRPKTAQTSPERCRKSNSTGSSKRWRFKDLLYRSNSDGKETFVFLSPSVTKKKSEKTEILEERRNSREVKIVGNGKAKGKSGEKISAHEIYVRNRDQRRSFLPYKQDIVGFFTNVNGLSKTLHHF